MMSFGVPICSKAPCSTRHFGTIASKSHDSGGWALDAWERQLVRGLKQVKTPYHLREHRLVLWPRTQMAQKPCPKK